LLFSPMHCLMSCVFLCFAVGCGSAWHGRIVHLEDGKVVIQPVGDGKIESGRKILICRQKTITHPVTGEVLGTIRDNIAEVPVLRVRDRTITATAVEPEFDMMMVDDQATAVRGSVKPSAGSVDELGRIREVDAEDRRASCQLVMNRGTIDPGDILTVIRYAEIVIDPDTGEVLAVAVEPVADLQVTEVDADGLLWASYSLIDEKLGWIEMDDVVVRRTGDMLAERLWFQDPPDTFSEAWIFGRNYLHAVRQYDSGQYREAVLELEDALEIDPEHSDAAYLLGLCYANLNRYEEAAKRFEDLLKQQPDDARTWVALAYAYLKQGKLQGAVESYEKLAHLLPGDSKVWTDIGDIYRMLGDHEKAEQAYRKALEIDGDDEEARYELQAGKIERKALATD
jgi:Flp pilus assembly protein TadD